MPSRNTIKTYADESYYHIYNRGVNKRLIFLDDKDYRVFLNLFKRYLSLSPTKDNKSREYEHLRGRVELLAYCLMPNHIHILVYVQEAKALSRLLSGVMTSYSMYFNKRYKRVGPLFQGRFKASLVSQDQYLLHISRYIHLNPSDYKNYRYSSLYDYLGKRRTIWLQPKRILELFQHDSYETFVSDYEEMKRELDSIKSELADAT